MAKTKGTVNKERYYCIHCGMEKSEDDFNKSQSGLYCNFLLPVCKSCLDNIFETFKLQLDSPRNAAQRVCMLFDIWWNEKIFNQIDPNENGVIGKYVKKINKKQYMGRTFSNSIEEGFRLYASDDDDVEANTVEAVSESKVKKWGSGFTNTDYETLEDHYKYLKKANPNCDSNQEIFIMDLCYIKSQQMRALRESRIDDYNKLTDSYRKSFTQAGLKTVKDIADDDIGFGVTIETIERYTPAEYYRDQSLFRDFDKLKDYIERFMLRPLRNLMHGSKDRDSEFYIKEEDEVNG